MGPKKPCEIKASFFDWTEWWPISLPLLRSSKADVVNAGEVRNHFRSGGPEDLCVLEVVARVQNLFPHRFGRGSEAHLPVCRFADGDPVQRQHLTAWLKRAASAEGYEPQRFRSRALRIGGATASDHAGTPVGVIKRYGRWASDAVQLYFWEGIEDAKGLSQIMAKDIFKRLSSLAK